MPVTELVALFCPMAMYSSAVGTQHRPLGKLEIRLALLFLRVLCKIREEPAIRVHISDWHLRGSERKDIGEAGATCPSPHRNSERSNCGTTLWLSGVTTSMEAPSEGASFKS